MCELDFLSNFTAKSYVQYICSHLQEPVFNSCMDSAIDPGIVLGLAVVGGWLKGNSDNHFTIGEPIKIEVMCQFHDQTYPKNQLSSSEFK